MEEDEVTGIERDLMEWKSGLIAGSEESQEIVTKYTEGSNGWKPTEHDEKLSLLQSMDLPEEEAFALWKAEIQTDADKEKMESLEEKGLPAIDFYRYKVAVKHMNGYENPNKPGSTKSGSRQEQVLQAIDGLNLTTAQKDLLWDYNDWSSKTRGKAPWH